MIPRTQNKKGAMQMSVGTIVTIVLLMSVLILGIFLVQNIFQGAQGAIGMTNSELEDRVSDAFSQGDASKVTIIPTDQVLKIGQGELNEIAVGIKNNIRGSDAGNAEFSYNASPSQSDLDDCGISEQQMSDWVARAENSGIKIPAGDQFQGRIRFDIPEEAPLCTIGFNLETSLDKGNGEEVYSTTKTFDIDIVSSTGGLF